MDRDIIWAGKCSWCDRNLHWDDLDLDGLPVTACMADNEAASIGEERIAAARIEAGVV